MGNIVTISHKKAKKRLALLFIMTYNNIVAEIQRQNKAKDGWQKHSTSPQKQSRKLVNLTSNYG